MVALRGILEEFRCNQEKGGKLFGAITLVSAHSLYTTRQLHGEAVHIPFAHQDYATVRDIHFGNGPGVPDRI